MRGSLDLKPAAWMRFVRDAPLWPDNAFSALPRMKLPPAIFLLAACAVLAPAQGASEQNQGTETKVRLLAEALTARDRGDFATAKTKFEALLAIVPNDVSVRRMIADVDARVAAREAARLAPPPRESAPVVAAEPVAPRETVIVNVAPVGGESSAPVGTSATTAPKRDSVMPAVLDEKPPGLAGNAPVPEKDPYAEVSARIAAAAAALAQSENLRLGRMGAYLDAQRELARLYARDGNYPAAVRTLDVALGVLQSPVKELKAEREEYVRQNLEARRGPRVHVRR